MTFLLVANEGGGKEVKVNCWRHKAEYSAVAAHHYSLDDAFTTGESDLNSYDGGRRYPLGIQVTEAQPSGGALSGTVLR